MYPLVGRLDRNRRTLGLVRISTQAPLAGCDCDSCGRWPCAGWPYFNPCTPCGVRRYPRRFFLWDKSTFQSTHPLRGATPCLHISTFMGGISIHASLAGCDRRQRHHDPRRNHISIHAPLAGCDVALKAGAALLKISIHAPLAGCDSAHLHDIADRPYFNPRTPCGVRLWGKRGT